MMNMILTTKHTKHTKNLLNVRVIRVFRGVLKNHVHHVNPV